MSFVYEQLRFLVRGGTAANLTTVNEIPLKRELVIETDTLRYKLGDGITAWNALPYASGGGSSWRHGAGVPSNSLGANGDYYLRTSNGDVYAKAANAYTVVANIKGADGAAVQMRFNAGFIQWRLTGAATWIDLLDLSLLKGDKGDPGDDGLDGDAGPPGPASSCFPAYDVFNTDPSADIDINTSAWIYVPFGFDITGFVLTCQPAGEIEIDVRVSTFVGWPAGPGDSICGGNRPRLNGGDRLLDTTLTGWGTEVPAGSFITFVPVDVNGVNRARLQLIGQREIP